MCRSIARLLHALLEVAERQFHYLQRVYKVLSSQNLRKRYDEMGEAGIDDEDDEDGCGLEEAEEGFASSDEVEENETAFDPAEYRELAKGLGIEVSEEGAVCSGGRSVMEWRGIPRRERERGPADCTLWPCASRWTAVR